ncbi:MAG: hypothetical protein ACT4OE_08835 [Sphingosinicella sp.]
MADAQAELDALIDRCSPQVAALGRACLARLRTLVPGATQLVYDNFNALVIGFGPTGKPGHAILSLAFYPRWVTLFFFAGRFLDDPHGLLGGSGAKVRSIRIGDATTLDDPRVTALIAAAIDRAEPPFDPAAAAGLVIRAVSPNKRRRR